MTTDLSSEPPRPVSRRGVLWGVLGLLLFGGLLALAARSGRRPELTPTTPADDDPRLTLASPYRNVRPEVAYVGDAACGDCHLDVAKTYRRHPMGRSLAPISPAASPESFDPAHQTPFEAAGFLYSVLTRGTHVFHRETRPDARGQSVLTLEEEIPYVLGSGTRGRSYLVNLDGYLFQSPISWYTQKNAWDLAPGYRQVNPHFGRAVEPLCVFCHANDARPVADTTNRYQQPLFQAHAIGCERCHGPGALHVRRQEDWEPYEGRDDTIVNPKHLDPELREDVCRQCHLQGTERTLRRGRGPFDYRPGLPLNRFWTVFEGLTDSNKAVGQVEQMEESACYRGSKGQLGCTSCHDPHSVPAPERRAAFYRSRCLNCHEKKDKECSLSAAERRARNGNDCAACHLPRADTADIAHTALSDHRVPRRPNGPGRQPASRPPAATVPLVPFHPDQPGPGEAEVSRDLGVGLASKAWTVGPGKGQEYARLALPALAEAARTWPDDVAAHEARGGALLLLSRPDEALAAFEDSLAHAPRRERALIGAALSAEALKRTDVAFAYWQRAGEVNPWSAQVNVHLAHLLRERGRWDEAVAACERVLRLNPAAVETRMLLILCLLRTGQGERARAESEKVLALDPASAERLQRLLDEQSEPRERK
jgi:predicted CXXCH cytochrome family protein